MHLARNCPGSRASMTLGLHVAIVLLGFLKSSATNTIALQHLITPLEVGRLASLAKVGKAIDTSLVSDEVITPCEAHATQYASVGMGQLALVIASGQVAKTDTMTAVCMDVEVLLLLKCHLLAHTTISLGALGQNMIRKPTGVWALDRLARLDRQCSCLKELGDVHWDLGDGNANDPRVVHILTLSVENIFHKA